MPLDSIEVRWFVKVEKERYDEFVKAQTPGDEKRGDTYFIVAGAHDFGIKVRGGKKPEFKGRTATLGTQVFAKDACGLVEKWTKWSYEDEPSFDLRVRSVVVDKLRFQRKYVYDFKAKDWIPAATHYPDKAANIEVTGVTAHGAHWISVGVEAFPTDPETVSVFPGVVRHLVDFAATHGIAPDVLRPETSASYPAWLATL